MQIAIDKMQTSSTAGIDGIAPEFIKYGRNEVTKYITKICQKAWNENKIPDKWKKNIIIPIHKKGSSSDCNNYRAISLSSVVYKIYTRILERRLRSVVDEDMEEEQAAFRTGRQTQDHIYTIRTAMEKNIERNKTVHLGGTRG